MPFQGVEMTGPVAAVTGDPFVHLGEAVGTQRIDAALSVRSDFDESDLAQHPQVPRHGRLGQARQRGDQFSCRAFTLGEGIQQGTPARFGDCLEDVHFTNIADDLYRRNRI